MVCLTYIASSPRISDLLDQLPFRSYFGDKFHPKDHEQVRPRTFLLSIVGFAQIVLQPDRRVLVSTTRSTEGCQCVWDGVFASIVNQSSSTKLHSTSGQLLRSCRIVLLKVSFRSGG